MIFPWLSTRLTSSPTVPAAAATSGSCFTRVRTEAEKAGVASVLLSVFLNATFPLITASEFSYDVSTIFVNAPVIVSVRMYVPLTMATPSTIASAVRMVRSLRPSSPLRATPIIVPALP